VFLHIVGAAMIVGYWIATIKTPTVHPRQRDGAFLQLLTGIAMMGLLPLMPDADPNYFKLGIKFAIGVAVAVLAVIGSRKVKNGEPVSTGLAHGVGGLALVNIAIATLWN
jgi:hypothetical protein